MLENYINQTIPTMAITANSALQNFAAQNQGNLDSIAGFIVDNNKDGVFSVLRANGYTFTTDGEASVILKGLFVNRESGDTKVKSVLAQLASVPYLNDATNGTGGVLAAVGSPVLHGAGDDLLCLASGLFGVKIGCPPEGATPEQVAAATKEAQENAAKSQRTTYIIIGVSVVLLLITVIYFTRKPKN